MNHSIKCPKCQGQGYKYLNELRWFFQCVTCGYFTYLKLLNQKPVAEPN